MITFRLSALRERSSEVAKAMAESPVMIIDQDGRPFGVIMDPDEYCAIEEVVELARSPEAYAKATEELSPAEHDRASPQQE